MKSVKGFTLIELLISVAIVGVLASIAIPSYRDNVEKSRRRDAQAALMQLAQAMERFKSVNMTYVGAANASTGVPNVGPKKSPIDGTKVYYNLRVVVSGGGALTATSYTLQAIPDSAGPQINDRCATLTLTNALEKWQTGTGSQCW